MSLEQVRCFGVVTRVGMPGHGLRRFGVPPGGAFDRESLMLANALAGLPEDMECWELGMANVVFRARNAGAIAIVGAPVAVSIDGRIVPSQCSFPVLAGAEIHISPPDVGARTYVAFRAESLRPPRRLASPPATFASSSQENLFRVVRGPQAEAFGPLRGPFSVGLSSDRVGLRLDGAFEVHELELPSEPACLGAIQVTREGGLLILGPEGPTIGGYPKVAVVIDADTDRLGQLRPGAMVTFREISLQEAKQLRSQRLQRLQRQCAELRAAEIH